MWSDPRRAHPAGVLLYVSRSLGGAIVPVVGLFAVSDFATDDPRAALGVAVFIALTVLAVIGAVVIAWLQWRRFTFHIQDGALRVEQGLLIRKSTRLTPERIQSVDTKANLIFRVFGLVTVDIHTAGRSQAPEVSIPALTEEEARALSEALRSRMHERGASGSPAQHDSGEGAGEQEEVAGPSWRLTGRELAVVSLTSNAGVFALAFVAPALAAVVPMLPGDLLGQWELPGFGPLLVLLIGISFLSVVVFAWLAGGVATALQYWDFSTSRMGGQVRVEQGLLQRNTRNVPLDRVQAVRLIEGPLRQIIGRVTIGVDSAGIAAGTELGPTTLHPLLARADAARFCELMVPGHAMPPLEPLPARSRRRYVVRAAALPLLVTLPLSVAVPLGWLALLVPVGAAAWALLAFSDAAWGVSGDVLALRWRGLGRTTALVRRRRVQSVSVSQHPLQRMAGLVTLSIRVASSPSTAVFTLRHLDEKDAIGVLQWVSRGVVRTEDSV